MKALIYDDKVVDVKEQSYEVHPSMKWIDCPNDIKIGFFHNMMVKPLNQMSKHLKKYLK